MTNRSSLVSRIWQRRGKPCPLGGSRKPPLRWLSTFGRRGCRRPNPLSAESRRLRAHTLALLLLSTACAAFPPAGLGTEQASDYAIELQQIQSAISGLEQSASNVPFEAENAGRWAYLQFRRAALTGSFDDFTRAESALDWTIRQIGPVEDLYLLKANLDFKLHRLAAAKDDLARLTDLTGSAEVETLQADIALQEGRYVDAGKGYESVIRQARTWDRLARLAHLKSLSGDMAGAEALYLEAQDEITAKEMRSYAWVELQRGILDFKHGRHDEAMVHYRRADKAYSGYWLVGEYIAELLGARGKFDEAVAHYEKVLAQAPRPEIHQALGDLYAFMGKPEQAKPWHEKALAAYLDAARRGGVQYFHHLAGFYADVREDGAEAVKWAHRDLELRRNFATRDALAWALYRDGRFGEAIEEMNRALSYGIQDAHLFFHGAMVHLAAGRTEEGKQFLQMAAEINPRFETFHVHR